MSLTLLPLVYPLQVHFLGSRVRSEEVEHTFPTLPVCHLSRLWQLTCTRPFLKGIWASLAFSPGMFTHGSMTMQLPRRHIMLLISIYVLQECKLYSRASLSAQQHHHAPVTECAKWGATNEVRGNLRWCIAMAPHLQNPENHCSHPVYSVVQLLILEVFGII